MSYCFQILNVTHLLLTALSMEDLVTFSDPRKRTERIPSKERKEMKSSDICLFFSLGTVVLTLYFTFK